MKDLRINDWKEVPKTYVGPISIHEKGALNYSVYWHKKGQFYPLGYYFIDRGINWYEFDKPSPLYRSYTNALTSKEWFSALYKKLGGWNKEMDEWMLSGLLCDQ